MGLFKSSSNAGRDRPGKPAPRSNIRGKISGPIPIPDDDFPPRTPDPTIAEAQEALPEHLDPPAAALAPAQRDSGAGSMNSTFNVNVTREEKTDSIAQSGPSQASTTSNPMQQRRTNRSSVVRYSNLSEATDGASPSRKRSGFRFAISRLFGKRNKKRNSRSHSDSEAQLRPSHSHDHHNSVSITYPLAFFGRIVEDD